MQLDVGEQEDFESTADKILALPPDQLRRRVITMLRNSSDFMDIAANKTRSRFFEALAIDEIVGKIYPCTVFAARYKGIYEGAPWIALHSYTIPQEAQGDDIECNTWFDNPSCLVGRGNTPNQAMLDLHRQM